jgi:hypothetical protein
MSTCAQKSVPLKGRTVQSTTSTNIHQHCHNIHQSTVSPNILPTSFQHHVSKNPPPPPPPLFLLTHDQQFRQRTLRIGELQMVRVHAGTVGNAWNVVRTGQRVDPTRFGNAPAPSDVRLQNVATCATYKHVQGKRGQGSNGSCLQQENSSDTGECLQDLHFFSNN